MKDNTGDDTPGTNDDIFDESDVNALPSTSSPAEIIVNMVKQSFDKPPV